MRIATVMLLMLLAACERETQNRELPAPPASPTPSIERTTQEGPVSATVALSPAEPRLGDTLRLSLSVVAQPDVAIEMPAFGEALGRFAVLDYAPRQQVSDDGVTRAEQHYTLQIPMSGKLRLPPLRLEYLDERSATSGSAEWRELLTDSLTIDVASVLPQGHLADELLPPRGELAEHAMLYRQAWLWPGIAIIVAAGAVLLRWWWRRRSRERTRITAGERALARLAELERRGVPSESGEVDNWYVELSDIVRRFLEDQYGVRAPELTTEEFLLEAQRSAALARQHGSSLSAFLARCDQVKFAAYEPAAEESHDALSLARRFLSEASSAALGSPQTASSS